MVYTNTQPLTTHEGVHLDIVKASCSEALLEVWAMADENSL